jgi:two-component system phosphate regulon response regulator PhoB
MLPKMSGLDACAKLKADTATRGIPVVIVSARGADADVIVGLEAGADDYIIKPFHPPSFVARVREILRRAARPQPEPGQALRCGELILNPERQEVRLAGDTVTLTDKEFQVLHDLARHAGRVRTRGQIEAAWGPEADDANADSVDDRVTSLCQKLGQAGSCIEAVGRIGFRFKDTGS